MDILHALGTKVGDEHNADSLADTNEVVSNTFSSHPFEILVATP